MDWTQAVDAYCERLGPGLWAEPINAVTNLAFVAAAVIVWRGTRGVEAWLAGILFVIGIGSGLFHTFAEAWAGLADVLPILTFILTYVYAANLRVLAWPAWGAVLGALLFVPYAAAAGWAFGQLPFFAISAVYWPVPLLIALYGAGLWWNTPRLARDLWIGAGILCVSLVARSLDGPLCGAIPIGTHFLWHVLNAVMLGWMILVLRRHRLEYARQGG